MKKLIYLIPFLLCGCGLIELPAPPDWVYHPPQPEPIETDTCTNPIEVTEPAFILGYIAFDTPQDSIYWQGGGIQSNDLGVILEHLIPNLAHTIYHNDKEYRVVVKGTNAASQYTGRIFAWVDGAKVYMTFYTQRISFSDILTVQELKEVINQYPSVNNFDFWNTSFDSTQYNELALLILGECKEGRYRADFRHNPYEIPDSIITAFEQAGWEKVLH